MKPSLLAIAVVWCAASAGAGGPPAAVWQPPRVDEVRAEALAWLASRNVAPNVRAEAEAVWSDAAASTSEDGLLDRLAQTFALADPRAARLLATCSQPRLRPAFSDEAWLRSAQIAPMFGANLRLYYARWLVHESLFDEAREQLSGLTVDDVAAPASLLFYHGVVDHALLNKESGLKCLDALLAGAENCPRRYAALARLMRDDLAGLEDDSLDHIARRMDDVRRRLDLGHAGPRVRKQEQRVIESLDKIIDQLEQRRQQQQQAADNAKNLRPNTPAPDSRTARGKGPGEVTKKNIGNESGWGNLPPKEREEAMQQVGRDFPAHYRDAIEQYFRRLAAEGSD